MINNCIVLIAAILLYISIYLSSLSSKKTVWFFNAFLRGFFISLFPLALSVTSEIFKIGFNFKPEFFILGMKSTANYITTFERLEKEIERQNTKVCPNCGETVNKIAKVCHYCGYKFKSKKKNT